VPDPLPVVDSLPAASARVRGWTLVTGNVADLERGAISVAGHHARTVRVTFTVVR
jgi:hypothetical protein